MKNKDRYNLTELKIRWESGSLIEVFDGDKGLFITNGWTDKILLESLLGWLEDEYHILDEKEKEYLSYIIRPWRDKVISIYKLDISSTGYERLIIKYEDIFRPFSVQLPQFKKGKRYQGMEPNREYTLEELGL